MTRISLNVKKEQTDDREAIKGHGEGTATLARFRKERVRRKHIPQDMNSLAVPRVFHAPALEVQAGSSQQHRFVQNNAGSSGPR